MRTNEKNTAMAKAKNRNERPTNDSSDAHFLHLISVTFPFDSRASRHLIVFLLATF